MDTGFKERSLRFAMASGERAAYRRDWCWPANTGCCSHGGRRIVSRTVFSAAAVQQNPVSLAGVATFSTRTESSVFVL